MEERLTVTVQASMRDFERQMTALEEGLKVHGAKLTALGHQLAASVSNLRPANEEAPMGGNAAAIAIAACVAAGVSTRRVSRRSFLGIGLFRR